MRLTEMTTANDFIYNLQSQSEALHELQKWISSGSKILNASDDPVGAGQVMTFVEASSQNDQFLSNMEQADLWFTVSNSAMQQYSEVVQRANELSVSAVDASKTDEDRAIMAEEIESLIDHLVMIGNTTVNGDYMFGGTQTTRPPFVANKVNDTITSVTYQGDNYSRDLQITSSETVSVNAIGSSDGDLTKQGLFIDDSQGVNVFDILIKLRDDLTGATVATGTASGAAVDTTHMVDATQAWDTDEYAGYYVKITGGTGAGQTRLICSNDATTMKVDEAWDTAPDATSTYEIVGNWHNISGLEKLRDYGTASAGGAATVTDATQTWTANRWAGYQVKITGGTGAGQTRTILSNTANALTVTENWDTVPDATSTYEILALPEHELNDRITELDESLNNLTKHMAYLGNKQKRIDWNTSAMNHRQTNIVNAIDNVQGVDMAEAMTRFMTYQQVYQATAQTGSKLLPMSLLNYIR